MDIKIVGSPFAVNVEAVPHHLQMELCELQCDSNYKHLFSTINDALIFYKQLDMTKYKNSRQHAVRMTSFFGSTYICEQAFSKMNVNKSSFRSSLTDGHLEDIMQIVCHSTQSNNTKLCFLSSHIQVIDFEQITTSYY